MNIPVCECMILALSALEKRKRHFICLRKTKGRQHCIFGINLTTRPEN